MRPRLRLRSGRVRSRLLATRARAVGRTSPREGRLAVLWFLFVGCGGGAATSGPGDLSALVADLGDAGTGRLDLRSGDGTGRVDAGSACPAPAAPAVAHGSARRVCQLIGDTDRALMQPTLDQTFTRYMLSGTDLGASFEHDGKLWFLFGDSRPAAGNPVCGDALAFTTAQSPAQCIPLTFLTQQDGAYASPLVDKVVNPGCFDVPLHGVSNGPSMYVWFSTNCMTTSALARSDDDGATFRYLYTFSDCGCGKACVNGQPPTSCMNASCHFVNVSAALVPAAQAGALPGGPGDRVVLFGSGSYRRSDVYLAVTGLANIEDRASFFYYAGMDQTTCAPRFTRNESDAVPLFHTAGEKLPGPCVGELSVHYSASLGEWLALYNCGDRIDGRVAAAPFGPYSAAGVVYDPVAEGAYCDFIYKVGGGCDALSDPGRLAEGGGVYGPYAIPSYTVPTPGGAQIYFLMSPWNPYDTMLMAAEIQK